MKQDRGEVERLIREAHVWLEAAGVTASPSKVSRLCRDFVSYRPPVSFGAFLARNLNIGREQVREINARYARAYADPTGETAVGHVLRERGY